MTNSLAITGTEMEPFLLTHFDAFTGLKTRLVTTSFIILCAVQMIAVGMFLLICGAKKSLKNSQHFLGGFDFINPYPVNYGPGVLHTRHICSICVICHRRPTTILLSRKCLCAFLRAVSGTIDKLAKQKHFQTVTKYHY